MKRFSHLTELILVQLLSLFVSSFILHPSSLLAQGPLAPPGAPEPTMKTLDQLEPRTPISSLPVTISNSGSYYLTGNFVVGGGPTILIATDNVTLDFKGFTITSTNSPAGGFGIQVSGARRNIAILNGNLNGGGTNIGGSYTGPGFLIGIDAAGSQSIRVSGMNVSGCQSRGINLGPDYSTVVAQCTVRTVGNEGITAGTVSDSIVTDSNGSGITAKTANNSTGFGGTGTGLAAENASNCNGSSGTGIGLTAVTAHNCSGSSSNNTGLNAATAQNCSGFSTNGIGLNATIAENSSGVSINSHGLSALTASNCRGTGGGGNGVSAFTAGNCRGTALGGGAGVSADTANNCYGDSSSGNGVSAVTANNCRGSSTSGTGLRAFSTATSCYGFTSGAAAMALNCDGTANTCTGQNNGLGTAIKAAIGIRCVKVSGTNNITAPFLGTVSP